MAYIYKITNKIDGKIYIGETARTIPIRWKQHLYRASDISYKEHLYNAMRKYGLENFSVEEVEECSDEERFDRETYYIILYKSYDKSIGYNKALQQDGADIIKNPQILKLWEEGFTINKIHDILNYDIKTISRVLKKTGITQEDIYKKRNDFIRTRSSKAVIQYTLKGEYIKEYSSVTEAAKTFGKSASQISKACLGQFALTAYGFIWQYKEDDCVEEVVVELKKHSKVGKNKKAILQIDSTGKIINEFESASAAGRSFGQNHSAFSYAARTGGMAYGYYWKYKEGD